MTEGQMPEKIARLVEPRITDAVDLIDYYVAHRHTAGWPDGSAIAACVATLEQLIAGCDCGRLSTVLLPDGCPEYARDRVAHVAHTLRYMRVSRFVPAFFVPRFNEQEMGKVHETLCRLIREVLQPPSDEEEMVDADMEEAGTAAWHTPEERVDHAAGSGSTWQDLDGDPDIEPGAVVLIGKHRAIPGALDLNDTNWSTRGEMDACVGRRAVVIEGTGRDAASCRCVRIAPGRAWVWRARDLVCLATADGTPTEAGDALQRVYDEHVAGRKGWHTSREDEDEHLAWLHRAGILKQSGFFLRLDVDRAKMALDESASEKKPPQEQPPADDEWPVPKGALRTALQWLHEYTEHDAMYAAHSSSDFADDLYVNDGIDRGDDDTEADEWMAVVERLVDEGVLRPQEGSPVEHWSGVAVDRQKLADLISTLKPPADPEEPDFSDLLPEGLWNWPIPWRALYHGLRSLLTVGSAPRIEFCKDDYTEHHGLVWHLWRNDKSCTPSEQWRAVVDRLTTDGSIMWWTACDRKLAVDNELLGKFLGALEKRGGE